MASPNGPLLAGQPLLDNQSTHMIGKSCYVNGLDAVPTVAFGGQQVGQNFCNRDIASESSAVALSMHVTPCRYTDGTSMCLIIAECAERGP